MLRSMVVLVVATLLLCLGDCAQADVFNLGPWRTNLDTVMVGDAGNAADTRYENPATGSVDYAYKIGKYEVTAAQYADFLNHKAKSDPYGLYNPYMWDDPWDDFGCRIQRSGTDGNYTYSVTDVWANRPVNYVSFWDACRFTNWLSNGQGNGDTETGAYTLNEYTGVDGRFIQRNAGWKWALPTEDEWYKAAYYKGGGTNSGYWDYPTQSDTLPSNVLGSPQDPGNNATCNNGGYWTSGAPYWRTGVGAHENSESAYGTFDQGGNIFEWNESVYINLSYVSRGLRGGSFYDSGTVMSAWLYSYDGGDPPSTEDGRFGFRVVQAVPEPSSALILLAGFGFSGLGRLAACRRKR